MAGIAARLALTLLLTLTSAGCLSPAPPQPVRVAASARAASEECPDVPPGCFAHAPACVPVWCFCSRYCGARPVSPPWSQGGVSQCRCT